MATYSTNDNGPAASPVPAFLTVEEAAAVLRIGRTAAYEATRRWRATGGAEGIAVVKVGGTLRVPRRMLEVLAGGPVELRIEAPTVTVPPEPSQTATGRAEVVPPPPRCRPSCDGAQFSLPFTA